MIRRGYFRSSNIRSYSFSSDDKWITVYMIADTLTIVDTYTKIRYDNDDLYVVRTMENHINKRVIDDYDDKLINKMLSIDGVNRFVDVSNYELYNENGGAEYERIYD